MIAETLSLFADDTELTQRLAAPIVGDDVSYTFVTDPAQLPAMFDVLSSASSLAYDLEFSDLNPWHSFQHLWQLGDDAGHIYVGVTALVPLDLIAPLLIMKPLIGHNLVTERKQTLVATRGLVKIPVLIDTMFAYQVAKAGLLSAEWGGLGTAGLDDVLEQYLGVTMDKTIRKGFIDHPWQHYIEALPEGWASDPTYYAAAQAKAQLFFTRAEQVYAANDVRYEHQAWRLLRTELVAKGLYDICLKEFGAIPDFTDMMLTGWTMDTAGLTDYIGKEVIAEDGTTTWTGLRKTQHTLTEKCRPLLLDGLNALEQQQTYDFVQKGHVGMTLDKKTGTYVNARKYGGKTAKTRVNHSKVEKVSADGKARFGDAVQQRLLTYTHTDIAMTQRIKVQDAFAGLGIDLEKLDKQAISDALDQKVSKANESLLKAMLDLAVVTKLLNTYGDKLLKRITSDGTLWFDFHMIGASATGRGSASNPNLQNIPARGELGGKYRCFFIAAPGCKLVIADYSSLEQRIAAHVSQDPVMLQIYRENRDMHGTSAAGIFKLDYLEMEQAGQYDRVTEEWGDKKAGYDFVKKLWVRTTTLKEAGQPDRKEYVNGLTGERLPDFTPSTDFKTIKHMRDEITKTVTFASNYGGNATTIGRTLKGFVMQRLEEIYTAYQQTYRVMFAFMTRSGRQAVWEGETVNLAGRKRFYRPGPWEKRPPFKPYQVSKKLAGEIERQGKNHPIQGAAADIMKDAQQLMYDEFLRRGWWKVWGPNGTYFGARIGASQICQVHDEVIVRCDDAIADEVAAVVEASMLQAEARYLTTVPASCSCHIGTSWADK